MIAHLHVICKVLFSRVPHNCKLAVTLLPGHGHWKSTADNERERDREESTAGQSVSRSEIKGEEAEFDRGTWEIQKMDRP